MQDVSGKPLALGATFYGQSGTIPTTFGSGSIGLLGTQRTFDNEVPGSSTGRMSIKKRRDQSTVIAQLVRNTSGIALLPGRAAVFKAGTGETEVDGYSRLDYSNAAGIVDPALPAAGVRDDDVFWLIRKGQTLLKTSLGGDATNVINEGDKLVALTAAASQDTTAGRVQSFVATSNVTNAASQLLNCIGHALSAKTTGNTNADLLAYVNFLRV